MLNYAKARKLSSGATSSRMLKLSIFPSSEKLKVKSAVCCRLLRSIAAASWRYSIADNWKSSGKHRIRFCVRGNKKKSSHVCNSTTPHQLIEFVWSHSQKRPSRRRRVEMKIFPFNCNCRSYYWWFLICKCIASARGSSNYRSKK